MELLTSTSAEQFQQCAEFLPFRKRALGPLTVTVLPVPLATPTGNNLPDQVADIQTQRGA
jgi:hypothetical protein